MPSTSFTVAKIRVLIVDDSAVARRLISDMLSADPAVEVVGVAANGRIALERIPQVNPEMVILDVEMPEMDGLETLRAIRQTWPRLPVIMFSSLTERGAGVTLEALTLGASDYVTKPSKGANGQQDGQRVGDELIAKIKTLCRRDLSGIDRPSASRNAPPAQAPRNLSSARAETRTSALVELVAIGVSTGGPNALAELIPAFPSNFYAPIVIVQHMPPLFTRLLAERLAAKGAIEVREAFAGAELKPGVAWIAPGNHHMIVEKNGAKPILNLNQDPPENSCRPAVDVLFRSAARIYGSAIVAVVLTGMGQDGLRGCEAIHQAGGQILVQDEASSVVWGMPGFVARAGLANKVLPLGKIGAEIMHRVSAGQNKRSQVN
jgi:two-component system, chemotaxis family, protein-glutamate methylesterase/glutaminase